MPWPVSAMVMRMPVRPETVVGDVVGADDEAASALTHGVDGVGDEVVEDLADVVFEAQDGAGGLVGSFDVDAGVAKATLIEIEDGGDQLLRGDVGGADGLAMEAEGLGGDLADTGELALRGVDVACEIGRQVVGGGDEVEQVGDGFEGIVDLVRDGGGETADGGELLALDEGGLGLLLVGDLEDDGGDGLDFAVGAVDGGVADVPAAPFAGTRGKLAFEDVVPDGMTVRDLLEEMPGCL